MNNSTFRNLTFRVASLVTMAFAANVAHAQQPIATPADLKAACETNAGNIVVLNQSTKVSLPIAPSAPLQVNCGCTVVLNNESTLEFEQASLQFAGAFTVQSTAKGEVKLTKSAIKAIAVYIGLAGTGSAVATSQSMLQALAGNLIITLGQQAKMELYGQYSRSSAEGLSATGALNISAGSRFTGSIADMAVVGQQGVQITANGTEGLLKLEKTGFRSILGSVDILANGNKSMLEAMEINFFAANASNIIFNGEENGIKLNEVGFFGPGSSVASTGSVTITASGGNGSMGKIEMAEISTGLIGGGFSVAASANNEKGSVKLEKSSLRANGAISFTTGRLGSTEVKENSITSLTSIVVKTGAGGNCVASPNRTLSAPVVETCAAVTALRSISSPALAGKQNNYSVYPNPSTNGSVTIQFNRLANAPQNIMVTNVNGVVIKQWSNYRGNLLVIDGLQKGIYNIQTANLVTGEKKTQRITVIG